VAVPPLTQPAGSPEPLAPGTGTAGLAYTKSHARPFAQKPVRYCDRHARIAQDDHFRPRAEPS
jgi:hypothetical protein